MQLYLMTAFTSLVQASFFLICMGDSVGTGYCLHVMPRPGSEFLPEVILYNLVYRERAVFTVSEIEIPGNLWLFVNCTFLLL